MGWGGGGGSGTAGGSEWGEVPGSFELNPLVPRVRTCFHGWWWAGRCFHQGNALVRTGLGGCSRAASRGAGPSWCPSRSQWGLPYTFGLSVHGDDRGGCGVPSRGADARLGWRLRRTCRRSGHIRWARDRDRGRASAELYLAAALGRSEADAALVALEARVVIYSKLMQDPYAALAYVAQVPLPPVCSGVSGVQRRAIRSRQQRVLGGAVGACRRRIANFNRAGRELATCELEAEDADAAAAELVAAEAARAEEAAGAAAAAALALAAAAQDEGPLPRFGRFAVSLESDPGVSFGSFVPRELASVREVSTTGP